MNAIELLESSFFYGFLALFLITMVVWGVQTVIRFYRAWAQAGEELAASKLPSSPQTR